MTLKELRKQILKLTQAEFAEQLGVSVRTYIRYEHDGAPEPILKLAGHIATEHLAKARDDQSNHPVQSVKEGHQAGHESAPGSA